MNVGSKRAKIEAMLVEDPTDSFLRYSLAMEYAKEGDHETSAKKFAQLAAGPPPYVPAFLMGGQQLVELGKYSEARALLRDGIEAARASGDAHAAGEMAQLLTSLNAEGD